MYKVKELFKELVDEMENSGKPHPIVNAILTFVSTRKGINHVGDMYKAFCQGESGCSKGYFNRVLESKWVTFKDESNDLWVDLDQPLEMDIWTCGNSSPNS